MKFACIQKLLMIYLWCLLFNNKNKMNKNNAFRRGFTLIELMIVIVILGILMGTILPRLTGAQARARDTARKADLISLSQALEVYYGDNGTYPDADTDSCLYTGTPPASATDTTTSVALSKYLKGEKMPTPPSKAQETLDGCQGLYYYKPLRTGGVDNASYVLATDIETWQLANYQISAATDVNQSVFQTSVSAKTYIDKIGPISGEVLVNNAPETARSIYIVIP
jgi:type II secretion system protein G